MDQKMKSDRYDSLWHLVSLGVLKRDHAPDGWWPDDVEKPTRVVMIDTSVAMDHPNLAAAMRRDLAFDLFSTRLGAFPGLRDAAQIGDRGYGNATGLVTGLPGCQALLTELMQRLAPDQPPLLGGVQPATGATFSGHGTAIAGLIGARPAQTTRAAAHLDENDDPMLALPYCGVDPTCEIVPVSTNFDTDPEQLIIAFLYADLVDADVIVLPRGIPDPFRRAPELFALDLGGATLGQLVQPCPVSDADRALWAELAELIVKLSLRRPVICAAGNENEEYGIYPASLASEHNGVIAVGAVNAKGWPCSYSPVSGLTVWAPSTDGARFDSAEVRLDSSQQRYDQLGIPACNNSDRFSSFQIISTDVPGQGGYAATPYGGPEPADGLREYGSYFCRFGGTSAACAIVAGLMSLARGLGQIPCAADGIEAKSWLLAQCKAPNPAFPNVVVPTLAGNGFIPADR